MQDDFFSDVELVYNVGWLVSGVQQSDSVIHIYIYIYIIFILFSIVVYYRIFNIAPVLYTVGPCCLSIPYVIVCIC